MRSFLVANLSGLARIVISKRFDYNFNAQKLMQTADVDYYNDKRAKRLEPLKDILNMRSILDGYNKNPVHSAIRFINSEAWVPHLIISTTWRMTTVD